MTSRISAQITRIRSENAVFQHCASPRHIRDAFLNLYRIDGYVFAVRDHQCRDCARAAAEIDDRFILLRRGEMCEQHRILFQIETHLGFESA